MLTLDNLIVSLFENFPGFKEAFSYEADEMLPYNIVGDFVVNFKEKFLASKLSQLEVDKFFDFVNQMANSKDIEVQNIFVVEVLELFSDHPATIEIAQMKLNDNGRQMLKKVLNGWR